MERIAAREAIERIAVIGSGIAGCLTAELLANEGYAVRVFEERERPFSGTSATALQAHLGGLYSADLNTAYECLRSAIEIKKNVPYALSDRNAMFLVADQSEVTIDEYLTFYEELAGYYSDLPVDDRVFGRPDDFFRVANPNELQFAKNITGGIVTREPGLDMVKARTVLLGRLARRQVQIATSAEVVSVKQDDDGFLLSVKQDDEIYKEYFHQVVNAGGYKCRILDSQLGDNTSYHLSLEAKNIIQNETSDSLLPSFYVVRGGFIHIAQIGENNVACLNTATVDGGYIDSMDYDDRESQIPEEWQEIMSTGYIPDARERQHAMIEFASDNFLVGQCLEPLNLIPGISTSFNISRQNRAQKDATVVTPGWQTIVPTKATHALGLAKQATINVLAHSALRIG